MNFWLVLTAISYLLFACGRLLWPNPDASLENKNQAEFRKLLSASEGGGLWGLLHKLLLPFIIFIYFPFYKPVAGLVVAIGLLALAFAL